MGQLTQRVETWTHPWQGAPRKRGARDMKTGPEGPGQTRDRGGA